MIHELTPEQRERIRSRIVESVEHPETYPRFAKVDELVDIIEKTCFLLDSIYEGPASFMDSRSKENLFDLRKALESCFSDDIVRPLPK